ncbi:hypothetical protein V5O48_006544 [Marasmius crinis-equi]|uniref:Uncharacterized protein n=1 Tax=Marasmius crinis-equi TaxID=585013 RepID=A0ABR3FJ84_9AGAR
MVRSQQAEDSERQYALLERRIRGLSTAIWRTRCQKVACVPNHGADRATLEAYQDFAVLLTRDSSVELPVVVTGGNQNGLAIVATTPASTVQSVSPSSAPLIAVEEVNPTTKNFHQLLVERWAHILLQFSKLTGYVSHPIPLARHAADILQVMRLLSVSTDASDLLSLYQFTIHRCWPEFKARVDASFEILAYPPSATLLSVLQGWRMDAQDLGSGSWPSVHISDTWLSSSLQEYGIPIAPGSHVDGPHFIFDGDTAAVWFRFLCDVLGMLLNAVFDYHALGKSTSLVKVVQSLQILSPLLDSYPINKLFSLPSLHHYLRPYRKRHPASSQLPEAYINAWSLNVMYDERPMCTVYQETEGNHILRYISSLLTWFKAATALFQFARTPGGPYIRTFHIIHVPIPPMTDSSMMQMQRPQQVVSGVGDELLSNRRLAPSKLALIRSTLAQIIPSSMTPVLNLSRMQRQTSPRHQHGEEQFWGGFHTQALAISVLKRPPDSGVTFPAPILVTKDRSESSAQHLVRSNSGPFASPSPHPTTSKCCYCCSLLYDILHHPQRYQSSLQPDIAMLNALPGFLIPWTPPPFGFGLSLDTLKVIERRLHELLLAIVKARLEEVLETSRMS